MLLKHRRILTASAERKFRRELERREQARSTVETYARSIRQLRKFLAGKPLTHERAVAWKRELESRHKPRTVNVKIAALNRFCAYSQG
jgi:hypothetical protein